MPKRKGRSAGMDAWANAQKMNKATDIGDVKGLDTIDCKRAKRHPLVQSGYISPINICPTFPSEEMSPYDMLLGRLDKRIVQQARRNKEVDIKMSF